MRLNKHCIERGEVAYALLPTSDSSADGNAARYSGRGQGMEW